MFRRKKENKSKLEHQLYLARENPEPIFDVSDCGLKNVPQGIYVLCKVFLKETLKLDHNYLHSLSGGGSLKDLHLLKILDISYNEFSSLPDEICLLAQLTELYSNNNRLKKLPLTICKLQCLQILDVSSNLLHSLPEDIGNLTRLCRLTAKNNKLLNYLPKSICHITNLKLIDVDCDNFVYPPATVLEKGTDFTIKYICDDTNYPYPSPKSSDLSDTRQEEVLLGEEDPLQAKMWELRTNKEQKLQQFLQIEREKEMLQHQEFELATATKINREKLLAEIAHHKSKFDSQLAKVQHKKDIDRFRLIEQLQEAEQNADIAIKQLLDINNAPLTQLLEQEKQEENRLLTMATSKYNETLSKHSVLEDMQKLLEQETRRFQQFDEDRTQTARSILEQEMKSDSHLSEVLTDYTLQKADLVSKLQNDMELQKAAVGALLERSDSRSWGLKQQICLVETQLAALTAIEMDKRKLKLAAHLNDFAEKRADLSALLMDLLDRQNERRAQLLETLQSLEKRQDDAVEDFWLRQYQGLLNRLPIGILDAQKNIDPDLAQCLLLKGVIHCMPFLAKLIQSKCSLEDITEQDLLDAGVASTNGCKRILEAFKLYNKHDKFEYPEPSAPPMPVEEASAPPLEMMTTVSTADCVVCMDSECHIIFIPCGHLCCCSACSVTIFICPMCRTDVAQKIRVVAP